MNQLGIAPAIIVSLVSAVAAYTDVSRFKVYNVVNGPFIISGIMYHSIVAGFGGFTASTAGALMGLAILLLPYLIGGLGAGDVKFVIGVGAWLGASAMIPIVLIGAVATLAYGLMLAIVKRRLWDSIIGIKVVAYQLMTIGRYFGAEDQPEPSASRGQLRLERGRLIPFTAMIAVGVLVVLVKQFVTN